MRVDPDNRLVADSLEAEWNGRLRGLAEAQEQYERQRDADRVVFDREQRTRILDLANDLPALWRDPATPVRERKRMLRLLVDDVTLIRGNEITVHIRFRGGATQTLTLPRPLPAWKLRQLDPDLIAEIDRMIDHHTDGEIAAILRKRGVRTYEGDSPGPLHDRAGAPRLRAEESLRSPAESRNAHALRDGQGARRRCLHRKGVALQRLAARGRLQRPQRLRLRASRQGCSEEVQVET